jgi:hypothetical protein
MPLQILVEDRLNEPYEILARKALGLPVEQTNRREIRASVVQISELTSFEGLLNLVKTSQQAGYDCIIFIVDEEITPASADRPDRLSEFRQAFTQLCDHLNELLPQDPLNQVNVIRIVSKRCLESWLATDPQAIIDAVRGKKGVNFNPPNRNTEDMSPQQASEHIVHIIREVGRQTGKRDLLQTRVRNVKRRGRSIALQLRIEQARRRNRSLAYFFDMVSCQRPGCEYPCPE